MLDNLISDLGLKFVGDRKFRFGIFKCKRCNKEFEIQIRRKTKGEFCKSCNTIKKKVHIIRLEQNYTIYGLQ